MNRSDQGEVMNKNSTQTTADIPSGMLQLMRHLGPDMLQVERVGHTGDLAFATKDTDALVDALVETIKYHNSDEVLSVNAALLLGGGRELAPLGCVLPKLVPLIRSEDKRTRYWAALALEFAAPAPGNEDVARPPSAPSDSLVRIAEEFPEVKDVAQHILEGHLHQDDSQSVSFPPRPA
jgi:hypothetical protein